MQRPVAAHRGHMSPAAATVRAKPSPVTRAAEIQPPPMQTDAGGARSHQQRLAARPRGAQHPTPTCRALRPPARCSRHPAVPSVGHFTTHVLGKSENENRDVPGHVSVSTAGGWRRRRLWFGDAYEFSLVEHTRREPVSRARTWYAPRAKTRKRHSAAAAAVPGPLQIRDFPG